MTNADLFHRIARTFANDGYEINRDVVTFICRDDVISIRLAERQGQLYVIDNDVAVPALKWLATRLARLDILADRITQYCNSDENFIVPSGDALLCPEHPDANDDSESFFQDASSGLTDLLEWEPAGTTSVVYITSDGGEGKTTLTNSLARQQACKFKQNAAPWLILPVELGGRPFLRLDEVTTSTLVNKFRFSYLYFDSLMEFCKLGFIVLAIDGFEEMFIQDPSGDATSSLGRLLEGLDSSGRVLISARKAFFEFNNLADQTRLYDSIGGRSVAFSRVALRRWNKLQFIEYLAKCGDAAPETLYERVANALHDENHPLLTRPVLVDKLARAVQEVPYREGLFNALEKAPAEYLEDVINAILVREAHRKWIDSSGDIAKPLMSVGEHIAFLSEVALEMWRSGGQVLRTDTLTLVAELFAEGHGKSPTTRHQIVKWAPHHALFTRRDDRFLEFDHEETFTYFLGRALASEISRRVKNDGIATILRISMLAPAATNMICRFIEDPIVALRGLVEVAKRESPTSIAMENSGLLLSRLISKIDFDTPELIEHVAFPSGSLSDRALVNIRFRACSFGAMTAGDWTNLVFEKCSFDRLTILQDSAVRNCVIGEDSRVLSVGLANTDALIFDPVRIDEWLASAGMRNHATPGGQSKTFLSDPDLMLVEKVAHLFTRTTEINEGSIKRRFGTRGPRFFDYVLPELLSHRIMRRIQYHGGGQQDRYELGGPLHQLTNAISHSEGKFATFLEIWEERFRK